MSRLIVSSLLLLTGAAHAASAADNGAAEQQIRAALAQWVDAANRGDYKSAFAVWAPDLIGWAPQGPDDTYAREQHYAAQAPHAPTTTYALHIDEVIVDGSLAVVRDVWTQTTATHDGKKIETFRSFEVWRAQPDHSWKISRWIDGPLQPVAK